VRQDSLSRSIFVKFPCQRPGGICPFLFIVISTSFVACSVIRNRIRLLKTQHILHVIVPDSALPKDICHIASSKVVVAKVVRLCVLPWQHRRVGSGGGIGTGLLILLEAIQVRTPRNFFLDSFLTRSKEWTAVAASSLVLLPEKATESVALTEDRMFAWRKPKGWRRSPRCRCCCC